jgi:hypothetical protein
MDLIWKGVLVLFVFLGVGFVLYLSDTQEKKRQENERMASRVVKPVEGVILHGCVIYKTNYTRDLVLENTNEESVRVKVTFNGYRGSENTGGFFLLEGRGKKMIVNVSASTGFYIYNMDGVNIAWFDAKCPSM